MDMSDASKHNNQNSSNRSNFQKPVTTPTNSNWSDINDLLASVTDVNRRLQNVDSVNKKLRQQKQDMNKELSQQKEQLSSLFQENCGLHEKAARLDLENKSLRLETSQLSDANQQLRTKLREFENLHRDCSVNRKMCIDSGGDSGVAVRNSAPAGVPAIDKIRILEKRHSSPQFFSSNESFCNSRDSSGSGKDITMDLQRQVLEKQKTNSMNQPDSILQSEYSLLGFDVPEEQMLQDVNNCLENASIIKRDADAINHNLKYLVHACFNVNLSVRRSELPKSMMEPVLVARGGDGSEHRFDRDLVSSNSEARTCIDSLENFCSGNADQLPNISGRLDKIRLEDSKYELPHLQILSPDYRLESQLNDNAKEYFHHDYENWGKAAHLEPLDCKLQPTMLRSDSSEVVVSSPPPSSSLLTPDSLNQSIWPVQFGNNRKADFDEVAVTNDEERKCPVCYAVFPDTVAQKDFEAHVLMHWDMEEYELINAQ